MKHKVLDFFSKKEVRIAAIVLAAIVVTSIVILLTPLRYTAIPPIPMQEVQPEALYKETQANPDKYLLIDVRSLSDYNTLHVPGSISVPTPDVYSEKAAFPRSGKTIVLICGDGRSAAVSYGFLQYQGFTNILHLTGGFNNWRSDNLPTESGAPR